MVPVLLSWEVRAAFESWDPLGADGDCDLCSSFVGTIKK